MVRRKRGNNILLLLAERQLGLTRCSSAQNFRQLSLLVTKSPCRRFVEFQPSPFHCYGKMRYGDGKIILPNRVTRTMDCYDLRHNRHKMVKLWSLPISPRWEDCQVETGPLHPALSPPLPGDTHRPGLLVLTADNKLRRFDLETGQLQVDILLSRIYRFTEMSTDAVRNWLILESLKSHKRTNQRLQLADSNATTDVLMSFIIFEPRTLQFKYHFEIRRTIFGKSVQAANIVGGLLLVMMHNKDIEVFSIDEVLSEANKVPSGEVSDNNINYIIQSRPACLYRVNSHHHHLEFNMNPWLYIKALSDQEFSVHLMASQLVLEGGKFGSFTNREKEEHLEFCPEQSTKLIHYGSHGLTLYEVKETDNSGNYRLDELFSYDPQQDDKMVDDVTAQPRPDLSTRSGRTVRRPSNYYEDITQKLYSVDFDYENELEVFAVLVSSETVDEEANAMITHVSHADIYDKYFKFLRRIPLDIVHARSGMDLASETSLIMDQDLLLVQVKTSVKTFIYIFQSRVPSDKSEQVKKRKR